MLSRLCRLLESLVTPGFGPGFGGDGAGLPVGHPGQTGQDVAQVGVGIDPPAAAAFHHGVEDSAALAGLRRVDCP